MNYSVSLDISNDETAGSGLKSVFACVNILHPL